MPEHAFAKPVAQQRSFADLGTPLAEVTFCVIDLETTGSSAEADQICEIGAVRMRGGEQLATLQTFVYPGVGIPPLITTLTGICDAHVARAPGLDAVFGSLLEFIGDAVIVGHNVRFDLSFLRAAADRLEYEFPEATVLDTLSLARRLVRDEVPNCKLSTLAERLRLAHAPRHRALDDALATADLLNLLIERASGWGVTGLEDLRCLPKAAGHPQSAKLALTDRLPRVGGVYLFRNAVGTVLYVGKAANLRARVRSYFSSDDRRTIGPLLAQTQRIDFRRTRHPVESAVLELRLIQALAPEFNRQGLSTQAWYLTVGSPTKLHRLGVTRKTPTSEHWLGPFPSASMAKRCRTAIEAALESFEGGDVDADGPGPAEDFLHDAFVGPPSRVADMLAERIEFHVRHQRFERAAGLRDALVAFIRARERALAASMLCGPASLTVRVDDVDIRCAHGVMREIRAPGRDWDAVDAAPKAPRLVDSRPVDLDTAEQVWLMARYLDADKRTIRLIDVAQPLASPRWAGDLAELATTWRTPPPVASDRGRVSGNSDRQRRRDDGLARGRRMGGHRALARRLAPGAGRAVPGP